MTRTQRIGHADIGVTLAVYAHVMPGDDEDAARRADALLEVGSAQSGSSSNDTWMAERRISAMSAGSARRLVEPSRA